MWERVGGSVSSWRAVAPDVATDWGLKERTCSLQVLEDSQGLVIWGKVLPPSSVCSSFPCLLSGVSLLYPLHRRLLLVLIHPLLFAPCLSSLRVFFFVCFLSLRYPSLLLSFNISSPDAVPHGNFWLEILMTGNAGHFQFSTLRDAASPRPASFAHKPLLKEVAVCLFASPSACSFKRFQVFSVCQR